MRSGIALSPQRRRRHPGRGDALGGFLSRRTRMLPIRRERRTREGGAARESKNEPEKKGRVRSRRNCLKKTRRPASGQHGTVCPASIEDHADAAWGRKNETAEILPLSSHRPPKRRRSLRPWVVSS